MKKDSYRIIAGVDLGFRLHQACALDRSGEFLGELGFVHTSEGLAELVEWLVGLAKGKAAAIAVGLEKPHGAVVDVLLERGIAVYAINPKKVDRFRDRHSMSGAKDDRRDAFVIADALRKDLHLFQHVEVPSPAVIALRGWLSIDTALCREEVAGANRLREQLHRYSPHLLELGPSNLTDRFFWEILERFARPAEARQANAACIGALLRQYGVRRLKPKQVLEVLNRPTLPVAPATVEGAAAHVRLLVQQLRLVHEQRRNCAKQMDKLLKELGALEAGGNAEPSSYTDVAILSSLPGVGTLVLASLLSYASEVIRLRDLRALRALGGVAPVTKKSGKSGYVSMRRACVGPLKNAFYHWARNAVILDSRFKKHYTSL